MLAWLPPIDAQVTAVCQRYGTPKGVAVGWIEKESGGNIASTTSLGERGFFQISPDEWQDLKQAPDSFAKLSTDVAFSLEWGCLLARRYVQAVSAWGIPGFTPGGEFAWRLAKFAHSIGIGAAEMIMKGAVLAGDAGSWGAFLGYCRDGDEMYEQRTGHSPARWAAFVDEVFEVGRQYGPVDSLPVPPANVPRVEDLAQQIVSMAAQVKGLTERVAALEAVAAPVAKLEKIL